MEKLEMIYEGKAKKLFKTEDQSLVLVEYKDSLTAFNAQKKTTISGKGHLNNIISANLLEYVEANGIPTHFVRLVDNIHQLVKKVDIIPLEVVVRNITTGSLCKRLGIDEGMELKNPLLELYLKDDSLGDPIVTEDHVLAFKWASAEEIGLMKKYSLAVNSILKDRFYRSGIVLVDLKLEFGRINDGSVVLADEISPDTCRLWDISSGKKLDKDRFRKDLGNVLDAYNEVWKRISEGGK